jgi:ApaG protein
MVSTTSEGVKVTVEVYYQQLYSKPINREFMFAYKVNIHNFNSFPIKVINRHWRIFDGIAGYRTMDGEGIVGMKPVIPPDESYHYISGVITKSDIGRMGGVYLVQRLNESGQVMYDFPVVIPIFDLLSPMIFN